MGQDLRNLFKKEREQSHLMDPGHEKRFGERLAREFPSKGMSLFSRMKIAASILVPLVIAVFAYQQMVKKEPVKARVADREKSIRETEGISLGDLSPDLRKVENYYVANINLELSQLEISPENKELLDSFMERLAALNAEYQTLNVELNKVGPNDQTITALIKNLQLRLQLLHKLKIKLIEFKSSENEQVSTNSI